MPRCGNCYQNLPRARFRENPRTEDGLHPNCISCQDGITGMTMPPELRTKAAVQKLQAGGPVEKKKLPWTKKPKRKRR